MQPLKKEIYHHEIRTFLKKNIHKEYEDHSEEYISAVDRKIQKIVQTVISKAKKAVIQNSECFSTHADKVNLSLSAQGTELIKRIFKVNYQLWAHFDPCPGVRGLIGPDALNPTFGSSKIFAYPVSSWSLKVEWTPKNPYIYDKSQHLIYEAEKELLNFWKAALNGEHTDIKFNIQGRFLHAHQAILKIKVPYFAKAFNSSMKESRLQELPVKEYSYEAFEAFLEFVYMGKINLDNKLQLIPELLMIGDYYQFSNLLIHCANQVTTWIQEHGIKNQFDLIFKLGTVYEIDDFMAPCLYHAEASESGMAQFISKVSKENCRQILRAAKAHNSQHVKDALLEKFAELLCSS